jgi:uncharacterized protein (TIGR02453 family)
MATAYFSEKTFKFQRALARNNNREWFNAHKTEYEEHLKQPFLHLIGDLQPAIAAISEHYRADPRPSGGSLFRVYRDTRFANDKTPYKPWAGARFFHERSKQVESPSFYLHIQPGNCFVGAGLWHPEPETQRRLRAFLFENPGSWKAAVQAPAFRRKFTMDGESLVRPPRGYPPDHELIEDLKRKNFVAMRALDDAQVTGPRLLKIVGDNFAGMAPLVDYLCAGLDLEF